MAKKKTKTTRRTAKIRKRPDKLTCTAYHEAGHAVVSYLRRVPFRYVTIMPNQGSLGALVHQKLARGLAADITAGIYETRTIFRVQGHVDVALAGAEAVKLLGGRNPYAGTDHDRQNAVDLAIRLCGSGESTEAYLKWRLVVVRGTLKNSWKDVEAVARALLDRKRLTQREVKDIMIPPLSPELLADLKRMQTAIDAQRKAREQKENQ